MASLGNCILKGERQAEEMSIRYQIFDQDTHLPVSREYVSRKRAEGIMNRKNAEYGRYKYTVRVLHQDFSTQR